MNTFVQWVLIGYMACVIVLWIVSVIYRAWQDCTRHR